MAEASGSQTVPLGHLTVFRCTEPGDVVREIVIQREEIVIRPRSRLRVSVARESGSLRMIADRADLAILDAEGNAIGSRSGALVGDEVLSLALDAESSSERRLVMTTKIVRASGEEESRFFSRDTSEPRIRSWAETIPEPENAVVPATAAAAEGMKTSRTRKSRRRSEAAPGAAAAKRSAR